MQKEAQILELLTQVVLRLDKQDKELEKQAKLMERQGEILEAHSEMLTEESKILQSQSAKIERLHEEVRKINLTIETELSWKIGAIFDKLKTIDERMNLMVGVGEQEAMRERMEVVELRVRQISEEVGALKRAQ